MGSSRANVGHVRQHRVADLGLQTINNWLLVPTVTGYSREPVPPAPERFRVCAQHDSAALTAVNVGRRDAAEARQQVDGQ